MRGSHEGKKYHKYSPKVAYFFPKGVSRFAETAKNKKAQQQKLFRQPFLFEF
jgi:hypothetical protein